MYDRHNDSNWGKHGNPNRRDWYHYSHRAHDFFTDSDRSEIEYLFKDDGPKIGVWTLLFVVAIIFILSGVSETARGVVFYGINITETWYTSVDSMLDALGAPKLP